MQTSWTSFWRLCFVLAAGHWTGRVWFLKGLFWRVGLPLPDPERDLECDPERDLEPDLDLDPGFMLPDLDDPVLETAGHSPSNPSEMVLKV